MKNKLCSRCGVVKDINSFPHEDRNGRTYIRNTCKRCRSDMKIRDEDFYKRTNERKRIRLQEIKNNKEEYYRLRRNRRISDYIRGKNKNLPICDLNDIEMLNILGIFRPPIKYYMKCYICSNKENLLLDIHDKEIKGILCRKCNYFLSYIDKDIHKMRNSFNYLNKIQDSS